MKYLTLVAVIFLSACGGLNVEKAPLKQVQDVPEDAQPAPFGLDEIRWSIPTGTPTVSQSPKGVFGLLVCAAPYGLIEEGNVNSLRIPKDNYRRIFKDTLSAQGYDVTGDPGRFFDEEEDWMRSAYAVGGRVTDVKVDLCRRSRWGIYRGDTGEANIAVEWTVFDLIHRKKVYKTVTNGYAQRRLANYEGTQLLLEQSLAAAMSNLGADPEFHNLIINGDMPAKTPETIEDVNEEPMGKFDPQEKVVLAATPLSDTTAQGRLENISRAVVMIEAADTHSSGFFITKEGHILTNAHAVGNAARVRVVSEGKKEKMIAEVLRIDRHRDAALLKLEEIPKDFLIRVLPLRTTKPKIGDDVYAIGAPELKRLQDTVTKGIVSALRYDREKKLPFIQADVDVYSGSSGGPLIDAQGNVIGIAVRGWKIAPETLGGLNWFIPIADALDKLQISH